VADGGEAADRSAVARGPTRPPPDAGGAAVLLAPVPPALAPPRGPGARVREGAGASPAVEARPRARAAGRPAGPRRGPHPLPPGSGAAARRLRGCRGPGGHAAGGGVRPPGPAPPTAWERGQTKAHPVPTVRRVQAPRPRLWRRETSGGRGPAVALACGAAVGTGAGRAGVPTPPRRQADAAEATPGPGADAGAGTGPPGPARPPAADRAWPPAGQALAQGHRPDPFGDGRQPRCRDGTLRCPASLPGAPDSVAANG